MQKKPVVAIIMGSQSDWATMKYAADTLEALGVRYEFENRLGPPHAAAAL